MNLFTTARRRPAALTALTTLTTLTMFALATPAFAAQADPPSRGAPVHDLVLGTLVASILTAAVLWLGMAHRAGRFRGLAALAGFSEKVSGIPGWAALPSAIGGGSLVIAAFGFYWDVAKHIDTGRDQSPFGTPAHYPILVGLAGLTLAGYLAVVLGSSEESPTSVRIAKDWHAPLGGLLILLCGGFALTGFPLDDIWHTLFGQDVTLWGPTHILMIAGASLATLAIWVLLIEAQRERNRVRAVAGTAAASSFDRRGRDSAPGSPDTGAIPAPEPLLIKLRGPAIAGGFLIGLSTLQAEFDFGVPQFQLVYNPILIMLATGAGLVAARIRLGRGGALSATAFYLTVFGGLSLAVGPVLGESAVHFPLYIAEAILVELAAARISKDRPLTLGLVSGALIGTIGFAAEYGWSHVWMPLPWPSSMLAQAIPLALVAALAAGVLGGFIGQALTHEGGPVQRAPRGALSLAGIAAVFVIGFPLPMHDAPAGSAATVALNDIASGPHHTISATVRLSPRNLADHTQWVTVTAWQGGSLVVDRLRKTGPGTYATTQPIPVYGKWKTVLRVADGRSLAGVPIYLPADTAIPAKGVDATASFTRPFQRDKQILQREALNGSLFLTVPAYLLLLGIAALWIAGLGVGLALLQGTELPGRLGAGGGASRRVHGRLSTTPA